MRNTYSKRFCAGVDHVPHDATVGDVTIFRTNVAANVNSLTNVAANVEKRGRERRKEEFYANVEHLRNGHGQPEAGRGSVCKMISSR